MSEHTLQKLVLLTFSTVHSALNAENILKELHLKHQVMPVPRAITTECGLCISIAAEDFYKVQALLDARAVNILAVYERALDGVNFRLLPKE